MEFLVILGPPGSGKGTLSRRLKEAHSFHPLSTGEEIRKQMADPGSGIGKASAPFMNQGNYIPDDLAIRLFHHIIGPMDENSRIVLDGFPRTVPQADIFSGWVNKTHQRLMGCVFLDLPLETAVKRMEGRRVCPDCRRTCPDVAGHPAGRECAACGGLLIRREDDDPVRMRQRLLRHREMTHPLRDWFGNRKQLLALDASVDSARLCRQVEDHFKLKKG